MTALNSLPAPSPRGTPDGQFSQSGGCIESGVGSVQLTGRPAAQQMLNIDEAQQFSTGRGVTVAEIDTGVNPHRFLTTNGRLLNGGDYILNDGNAKVDCDGHGTIVAGIIAADTRGTGTAFTGVAPDAKILAIKQTSTRYSQQGQNGNNQTAGDLKTLAEAIRFAADDPTVGVITMSVDDCVLAGREQLVLNTPSAKALQAAIHYAVTTRDKVVIAAAGNLSSGGNNTDQNGQQQSACQNAGQNDNANPNDVNQVQVPPVYADDVVSVASVDPTTGAPSPFTVWGPWVTIAAPGQGFTSVDPGAGGTGLSNSTTENSQPVPLQGTSFAAPYVAGVVALVRAKYPQLTARQVITRIEATAQHPSGPGGRNTQVGYGIIDPVAALTASIPGQNGVPAVANTNIKPVLPMAAQKDWTPIRVALIGTAGAIVVFLITLFVVRTVRRKASN
jgi:membrane-anchored mycosin MYCP